MTDKLVERLRERASAVESPMMSAVREQIEWEAADAIEGLEAEVKRLNEIEDRLGEAAFGLERELAEARAREEEAELQRKHWKEGYRVVKAREEGKDKALRAARPFLDTLAGMVPTTMAKLNIERHIKQIDEALAAPAPEPKPDGTTCVKCGGAGYLLTDDGLDTQPCWACGRWKTTPLDEPTTKRRCPVCGGPEFNHTANCSLNQPS